MAEQPKKVLTPRQEEFRLAIVERAKSLAAAAGNQWQALDKEQRRKYREQARAEMRAARQGRRGS